MHVLRRSLARRRRGIWRSYDKYYLQPPGPAALADLPYTLADLQAIEIVLPKWAPYFDNTNITAFPYRGNSIFHGLATEMTRRFTRGATSTTCTSTRAGTRTTT